MQLAHLNNRPPKPAASLGKQTLRALTSTAVVNRSSGRQTGLRPLATDFLFDPDDARA